MKYDEIVRAIVNGEKIYNLPLRVTYYCRVSTDSDMQLNSLDNQCNYYIKYIKEKTAWTYVDGYIEEGISGVSVDKRLSFKRMIRDAKNNKFDLIITKEVSRFARDLEDSIHYIRELKECGVGVFFENQNLNTFDYNSELILNIMFNIAQDESKKLSARVKFGHRQAIEHGHVLGSSNITGYRKDKCKLVIVEEEAIFIRKIYELYASGRYGLAKLGQELAKLGYYNKKGGIYDKDTLKKMIKNPKYKGYYRAHTYEIMDYRTKRRRKIPKEEQIIYKSDNGTIPAIVSEEIWNIANKILEKRTISYSGKKYSGGLKYPFSSKIYCKEHNISFQRSCGRNKKRPIWCCGLYIRNRLSACNSPIIAEKDLYAICNKIMKEITPIERIINDMIKIYDSVKKSCDLSEKIDKEIKRVEGKKKILLDLVFDGLMKKDEIKEQFKEYEKELKILMVRKENSNNCLVENNIVDEINNMFKSELVDDFIRLFVDKIIVSKVKNDRHNIKIDIYLNLSSDSLVCFMNGQFLSLEKLRKDRTVNKYSYNVYG